MTTIHPLAETKVMGPGTSDHEAEFIFIQGTTVVGSVVADCGVCAWKQGHPCWPTARMAVWTVPIQSHWGCGQRKKPLDTLRERMADPERQN